MPKMVRDTRPISWVKAARKDYDGFPDGAQLHFERALTVIAEGRYPEIAKPLKGFGSGVFELALRYRGDAYRAIVAVTIDTDVWVLHAFQKKSKRGIATPKHEVDLIRQRLRRLKEFLNER
jgi:phage-related protein